MFIDIDEITEVLGEYYNFDAFTPADWEKVDAEVQRACAERGITNPQGGDEEYYKICDGVIGRIVG